MAEILAADDSLNNSFGTATGLLTGTGGHNDDDDHDASFSQHNNNNNSTTSVARMNKHVQTKLHKRFHSIEEYIAILGGNKSHMIQKILIANNGVAAVKAIRSIRRWSYEMFGNERAIQFIIMATPEDLRANAEYIRMGDVIVDVPGGSNNHNYANVTLIVELARLHGVHAVWAGWGHASENPKLPDTLHASNPPIKFIGPSGAPMRALGDKIGSTIIAQSAGVPCIDWNGSHIIAQYNNENGTLPQEAFDQACIATATEARDAAEKIGFPIMIKASEGGGGKGIRRVDKLDDVADSYRQVCGEVPGSPIFIMKLSSNSRHLEVQLLADEYGNAIALNGRDCSVQRRHQKIIEEGPPIAANPDVWKQMEKAAIALAKAVSYANVGTVEYLYSESDEKFFFLELNPRLQVEHPVTEMITKVNIPAAQLQVAMGIPLYNIPEIRELYGYNRFEDNPNDPLNIIDFDIAEYKKPVGHCIAVRITAENAEAGFKPTSGGIQELNFRSTPNVWGYFSMDSSGSIHEFADSQFGHLFANGTDREQARRNMVLALKELSIRGDISTTVDYISKLIELEDYISNHIDTSWLDGIISENVDGMAIAERGLQSLRRSTSNLLTDHPIHNNHSYVVMAATIVAFENCINGEKRFVELLEKGQLPPRQLLKVKYEVELILMGVKYKLLLIKTSSSTFTISLNIADYIMNQNNSDTNSDDENDNITPVDIIDDDVLNQSVSTYVRLLSDGGYLIDIGGTSNVAYVTNKGDAGSGMRLNVAGKNVVFSPDYDPTQLRTDVAGKLVKKLKLDGEHIKKGEPYCEIEVMKMFLPLKVEESGILNTWYVNEGGTISTGDLLASLQLDNPDNVTKVIICTSPLQVSGWGIQVSSNSTNTNMDTKTSQRPHLLLRDAIDKLNCVISGYSLSSTTIENALYHISIAVTQPTLPVYEIQEYLSSLSNRIPATLYNNITSILNDFKQTYEQNMNSGIELRFAAEEISLLISNCAESMKDPTDKNTFIGLTTNLQNAVEPYTKSKFAGVPGSERALQHFLSMLRKWITVERWFCDGKSYADAVDSLRRSHKADAQAVLNVCRSHEQVDASTEIVIRILSIIGDGTRIDTTQAPSAIGKRVSIVAGAESLPSAMSVISEIGSMGLSDNYVEVALRARKLLMQESMPSLEQRRQKVLNAAKSFAESTTGNYVDDDDDDYFVSSSISREAEAFIADHIPMSDVFFPLLQSIRNTDDEVGLLELYLRHLYRPYTLKGCSRDTKQRLVKFSFLNKPSEVVINATTSVTSMTDLTRIVSSGSLGNLSEMSESSPSSGGNVNSNENSTTGFVVTAENRIPQSVLRSGACVIVEQLEDLNDPNKIEAILRCFPQYTNELPKYESGPINVLYLAILDTLIGHDEESIGHIVKKCEDLLHQYQSQFHHADMRRISFVFNQEQEQEHDFQDFVPALFTFRSPEFKEDSLYRRIDPSLAVHLHLNRIAENFHMKSLGSRHTSICQVHLYGATPRNTALAKDKKANRLPRVFVRALSFSLEFSSAGYERILVDALNALDLCSSKSKTDNHLFLNLVSDFERTVLDPVVVEQVVVAILKHHGERVSSLGIVEVETRIVCCLSLDSPPIAIRLFASNPTGYVHVMNTYIEATIEESGERVFKLISGTKASLASAGDSSWDGKKVNTPYPLTRPFDAQRKAALSATDTLYCYDIPALFEAAVEQQWLEEAAKKSSNINGGTTSSGRPLMVMYTTELVVQKIGGDYSKDKWTMKDYLNHDLELVHSTRGAGANDVGMVAWLVTLKTVEYPNGRQVVLIANDITHKAGSFGTREDVVFKMASEFAREKRIPRLFIAANSGARIGLAERVKSTFKVAFKQPSQPENGFNFLYVNKADYETLVKDREIIAEQVELDGEVVYKITDVIGTEPDLGVENLKGSGLIAGETSAAYEDIFTMTVVLGRTVGIGAYLVRLGQRTIQKSSVSPIILTGYQALNKLMGVDVYSTNDQLGGPGIMYSNGVSHLVEPDHLSAVKAAIDWLSYVPSARGGLLPISDIRGIDEIERPIGFTPMKGVPYDPRLLLSGGEDDSGTWQSGFFDRGSFKETLAGWAKTVVVGRARLGGIPMGVVITENRTAENVKPADPADVRASEAVIQEAGCVWFPNSAYKTAQAIKDFRTEDLPLIVFANWRGFSGGQRDMFDEVLKYGSLIVDAFVSYQQPVFVFIPPHSEIRGGAWVVLDASINASVMEMYAAKGSARGGVLEANGAASVKYRSADLIATMHRLDDKIMELVKKASNASDVIAKKQIQAEIKTREQILLPVYEQISVQFCELHDTPGRMKAVGVIEKEVEWENARSFFYWRLRRKLAEFDLRKKLIDAAQVGRGVKALAPLQATSVIKKWFLDSPNMKEEMWGDDKTVLGWMAGRYGELEQNILNYTKEVVTQEVLQVMTAGGNTAKVGIAGIADGVKKALEVMSPEDRESTIQMFMDVLRK